MDISTLDGCPWQVSSKMGIYIGAQVFSPSTYCKYGSVTLYVGLARVYCAIEGYGWFTKAEQEGGGYILY